MALYCRQYCCKDRSECFSRPNYGAQFIHAKVSLSLFSIDLFLRSWKDGVSLPVSNSSYSMKHLLKKFNGIVSVKYYNLSRSYNGSMGNPRDLVTTASSTPDGKYGTDERAGY